MRRPVSMWMITWGSLVGVAVVSMLVLGQLSSTAATTALIGGLEDHVTAQAGLIAAALATVPVETVAQVAGPRSRASLDGRLASLQRGGRLSDVALCGPGTVLGSGGDWLPGRAEQDLIATAQAGVATTGPLYSDAEGALYMTAYHPLPGHPGWAVAVEGSGATLGAAHDLVEMQLWTGAAMLVVVAFGASLVTFLLTAPLTRLAGQLTLLEPGAPAESVHVAGPQEVRQLALGIRRLLDGIRDRDRMIEAAHGERLEELSRLAAGVAHEIRNPLNAMGLTAQRIARVHDGAERERLGARLAEQVQQLDVIVQRLIDLTAPIAPAPRSLDVAEMARDLARESPLQAHVLGEGTATADSGMLVQVLRNLMLNAEQAGAQTVQVCLDQEADGLQLRFSDDGPGIPAGTEADLFRWFHTTRAQGTGLGLPQSRRLIEAMGGTLTLVAADPATFQLRLPR